MTPSQRLSFYMTANIGLGLMFLAGIVGQLSHALSIQYRWVYGDWVIHYGAGFVRRGLSGEWLLASASLSGLSLAALIFILCVIIFCAIVMLLLSFFEKRNPLAALLLFSPALLGFYATEALVAGRKECLLILAFLAFGWIVMRWRLHAYAACAALMLTLTGLIFFHEGLAFFYTLPLISIILICFQEKFSKGQLAALVALTVVLLSAFIWTVLAHKADAAQIAALCARLGDQQPMTCETRGAIEALGWDVEWLLDKIALGPYAVIWGVMMAVMAWFSHGVRVVILGRAIPLLVFYVASYLPIMLLAPFTEDWGRWIVMANILFVIFGLIHAPGFLDRLCRPINILPVLALYLVRIPICCTADPLHFTFLGHGYFLPPYTDLINQFRVIFG